MRSLHPATASVATNARRASSEPPIIRALLIGTAFFLVGTLIVLPIGMIFVQALRTGLGAFLAALRTPDARAAIRLTLETTAIVVPANLAFGLAAAWLLARFRFAGHSLLVSIIDLPLSVSPVVTGLLFVLLFGRQGWLGPFLLSHHLRVLFATPAIIIATVFVTLPYVAREVLPVLQAQGTDEEEAALSLGASGLQTFLRVTLPRIKWAVLYGTVLCTARAMGEFGAVSVVSGHVRGVTDTMPLQIEVLYNQYDFTSAFALASLLALFSLLTLASKKVVVWRYGT